MTGQVPVFLIAEALARRSKIMSFPSTYAIWLDLRKFTALTVQSPISCRRWMSADFMFHAKPELYTFVAPAYQEHPVGYQAVH